MNANIEEIVRLAKDMDYMEIDETIDQLEEVIKKKEKEAKKKAKAEIKATAEKYRLPLAELLEYSYPPRAKGSPKVVSPPEFRDPSTGRTWSGRGPCPKWVTEWKNQGGNIEDLRIQGIPDP